MTKLNRYLFKLSITATLTALSIALNLISIKIGNSMKITLYGFPLIIVGLFCGPVWGSVGGMVTALINDIFGYGISLSTIWWALAPIMWGLVPGLFRKLYFEYRNIFLAIVVVISAAFMAYMANNLAFFLDLKLFGYDYGDLAMINLLFRLLSLIISSALFSTLLFFISKPLYTLYGKYLCDKEYEEDVIEENNEY